MKKLFLPLVLCGLILQSCGWSDNQKEAMLTTMKDTFVNGAGEGTFTDEQVDDWANCVLDKCIEKWPNYVDFNDSQEPELVGQFMEECQSHLGLDDDTVMDTEALPEEE